MKKLLCVYASVAWQVRWVLLAPLVLVGGGIVAMSEFYPPAEPDYAATASLCRFPVRVLVALPSPDVPGYTVMVGIPGDVQTVHGTDLDVVVRRIVQIVDGYGDTVAAVVLVNDDGPGGLAISPAARQILTTLTARRYTATRG